MTTSQSELIRQELKPCPFCGGEASFTTDQWDDPEQSGHYMTIGCDECGAQTEKFWYDKHWSYDSYEVTNEKAAKFKEGKESLINLWNTRTQLAGKEQEGEDEADSDMRKLYVKETGKSVFNDDNRRTSHYKNWLKNKLSTPSTPKQEVASAGNEIIRRIEKHSGIPVGSGLYISTVNAIEIVKDVLQTPAETPTPKQEGKYTEDVIKEMAENYTLDNYAGPHIQDHVKDFTEEFKAC